MARLDAKRLLLALPFAVLLFILPFPSTVALRLLCLSAAFFIAMITWRQLAPPPLPCKPALLAWAGLALASLAYAVDVGYSLGEIKNEIGYTVMAFCAFFAVTRCAPQLRSWCLIVVAAATVISVWALWLYPGTGDWNDAARHGGRGSFASLAVVALPLLLLAGAGLFARGRTVLLLAGIAILGAAVASGQRIVWLAFGVQIALAAALLAYSGILRLSRVTLAVIVTGCLIAAGAALLLVHAQKVEQSPVEYYNIDNDFRLDHWQRVVARIGERPLSGSGFGREGMKKAYPDLVPTTPPLTLLWHPHNVFLTYGVAMGVPGMLALLGIFGALCAAHGRYLRAADATTRLVAITGIAIVAGVIVRNMTNDLFVRDGALLFWAIQGALLGYVTRQGPRPVALPEAGG